MLPLWANSIDVDARPTPLDPPGKPAAPPNPVAPCCGRRRTEIKRLMTVPGVSLMPAATFMAAVGDIHRFRNPNRLVSYLGLDPKVRQSGSGNAKIGRVSKQGAAPVRGMLVEAAFVAVSTPGPMRAFYQRVSARRGKAIAIVAVASSRCCSGICSSARRTTPSRARR